MRVDDEIFQDLKPPAGDMGSTIMALPSLESLRRKTDIVLCTDKSCTPSRHSAHRFKVRIANLPHISDSAVALIHERYTQRGYTCKENDACARRMTIVAYDGHRAIGTMGIRFDAKEGLLCDELYRKEIDSLRAGGRKICEFIKLAVSPSTASLATLAALFHLAFIYAYRLHKFDSVVMEVNPHHLKFYQRSLGFEQIGEETLNRRAGAPGVLLKCDFLYIHAKLQKFGGDLAARKQEKTLYPFGFSPEQEQALLNRFIALGIGKP